MMYNEKMLESFSKEYAERCQVTDKITAEMFDATVFCVAYAIKMETV